MGHKNTIVLGIILIVALTLTYSNHFNNGFHFDDSHTIQNNPYIHNLNNIPLYFKDARTFSSLPSNQSYRPGVTTTFAIDYWIGKGLNPFYFHLSMFIFFILQGILLFFLFLKILNNVKENHINRILALFATGWYCFHPANAETINYISSRSDSFSTFFVIMAFVVYQYNYKLRKTYLYLIPIIIGSFFKETTLMFAPILFVYQFLFEGIDKNNVSSEKLTIKYFVFTFKKSLPAFLLCTLLFFFIQYKTPDTWVPGGSSRILYLFTQPYIIFLYIKSFFLPFWLTADTDQTLVKSIFNLRALFGLLVIGILVFTAYRTSLRKETWPVTFGILWFLLALLPTSSIIPLSEVMNDHRVFFPYVGLVLSITWGAYLLLNKYNSIHNYTFIIAVFILALYAFGTFRRNKVWKDEETLWYDVTIKSPQNGRGLMNYGLTQMGKGKIDIAIDYYTKALEFAPKYHYLHINLAIAYNIINKPFEAEEYFKKALILGPNSYSSYYYYAQFLKQNDRLDAARKMAEISFSLSPTFFEGGYLLMAIYNELCLWDLLEKVVNQILSVSPNDKIALGYLNISKKRISKIDELIDKIKAEPTPFNYLSLSLYYYQKKDFNNCIKACNEALKLNPDYAEAFNNLCSAYNALGKYDEAIKACEKALEINPNFGLAKNNLVDCKKKNSKFIESFDEAMKNPSAENFLNLSLEYYQKGLYEKCIEACYKALKLKPDFAEAYNNMCSAYNVLGKYNEAIKACEKALEINPNFQLARNNLNWAKNQINNKK